MCKKTSITIGMAIAIIPTAYISALTSSNQVFAQAGGHGGWLIGHSGLLGQRLTDSVTQANVKVLGQEITQGIKTQVGKGLEFAWVIKGPGHPGLGCNPLDPRGC